ncbi:TPR-like protein, partial [Coniochaeta sp. PMI_546]
ENDDQESVDSDVDSDYQELRAETAKLNASIEAFRTAQRLGADTSDGVDSFPGASQAAAAAAAAGATSQPTRGRKLGPRKAAKPTPDILYRLSLATEAFHDKRYEDAHEILAEIIRINAETYDAWTLLSTVFEETGERKKALNALIYAAHLTPKIVSAWMNAGAYALEGIEEMEDGPERTERLQLARTLYAAAVRADTSDANARTTLADVLMSLGYAAAAAGQYQRALRYRPLNIRTVRNLADVALDAKDPRKTGPAAREAYRRVIEHCYEAGTNVVEEGAFEWSDLRIYLEFFGIGDEEDWGRAASELKEVARWLLGRREERCWEGWDYDDREWDVNDDRRVLVPGYEPGRFPLQSYGLALPVDLRAKLVIYRLRLGQHQEAALHMECLDPKDERGHDLPAMERFRYFPDCLKDVGAELLLHEQPAVALDYFDLYRRIAAQNPEDVVVDADMLVNQGRCYLAMGDKVAAEECFIGALDEDEYHIDARFELAKLYEAESEKEGREEAFLLVNEALDLEARQSGDIDPALAGPKKRRNYQRARREPKPKKDRAPRAPRPPGEKRKYRPRRLGGSAEKQRQEIERKNAMLEKYRAAMDLKPQVAAGDQEAMARWMSVAKDLVDDFRSSKQFFPWDKYVRFMGYNTILSTDAIPAKSSKLAAMAARLQQNLAPVEGQDPAQLPPALRHDHYGIPFEEWLDLLLDYALNLTVANQVEEAYVVLLSARDSVVFKSRDHAFLIHITWALCAVYAGDEEQCVHIARFFMRDYMPGTDSYRLFAAMVRLCQAPPSWYTSGPGQKFILRQIKLMDKASVSEGDVNTSQLDVCLLTLYGHILYTSQSYPYALSYFMRAASIDPTNPMINLSLGIGYIQYALKRQAPNRQYLITQGFAFFQKYYHHRMASPYAGERQEAKFNMGRAYHILGLGHLAVKYYREVLDESRERGGRPLVAEVMGREDLALEAAYNIKTICFQMGDLDGARAITEEWLVID